MADQGGDRGPPKFMAMNFGRNSAVHQSPGERNRINKKTSQDAIRVIQDQRVCLLFASELNNTSPNHGCFNNPNSLGTMLGQAGWTGGRRNVHKTTAMFWDERFLVEARVNERAWRFTDLISNAEDKRFVRRVLQRPGDDDSRFIAVGYHGPREDLTDRREKVQVLVSDFMTISQRDDMGRAPVLFAGDWNLDAETVDACFRQALRGSDYDHAPYYQRADGGADEGPARFTTGGNQPLDHFWVIWHRDDGGRVRDILGLQAPKVHYSQRDDDFAGREYYMLWRPDRKLNHYPVTVEAHGLLAGATPAAGQNIDLSAIEERLERIEGILNDIPQRLISALRNQGIVLQAGGGRGRGSGDGPEVSPGGDPLLARESSPATTITGPRQVEAEPDVLDFTRDPEPVAPVVQPDEAMLLDTMTNTIQNWNNCWENGTLTTGDGQHELGFGEMNDGRPVYRARVLILDESGGPWLWINNCEMEAPQNGDGMVLQSIPRQDPGDSLQSRSLLPGPLCLGGRVTRGTDVFRGEMPHGDRVGLMTQSSWGSWLDGDNHPQLDDETRREADRQKGSNDCVLRAIYRHSIRMHVEGGQNGHPRPPIWTQSHLFFNPRDQAFVVMRGSPGDEQQAQRFLGRLEAQGYTTFVTKANMLMRLGVEDRRRLGDEWERLRGWQGGGRGGGGGGAGGGGAGGGGPGGAGGPRSRSFQWDTPVRLPNGTERKPREVFDELVALPEGLSQMPLALWRQMNDAGVKRDAYGRELTTPVICSYLQRLRARQRDPA